jgi:hypothetical protein
MDTAQQVVFWISKIYRTLKYETGIRFFEKTKIGKGL